jgi:DMSO/TMAO reductase YedYZ molybdopterin-dependent catalytic subunit
VVGGLTGLVATAVALAAGHLAAAFSTPAASPVLTVGQTFVDHTPEWLKSWAIRTFGSNDKNALLTGIFAVLAILSVLIGSASRRRHWIGYIGLGVLTAIGVATALTRPTATVAWALPSVVAGLAGLGAFIALARPMAQGPSPEAEGEAPVGFDRRRFLRSALALSATAAASGAVGRYWGQRLQAEAGRASLKIPPPASPAKPLAAGVQLNVGGISPFYTPNNTFYRVDTALLVPRIQLNDWKLQIHGMVEHPTTITFRDLIRRPLIERDITLNCVSNQVGGRYIGNARWIGAALGPILEEVGVLPGATQIVAHSVDGMTIGTPTAIAMDGRDSMLAVAMNGEPLPFEHGFPVRMLVPGLYGYESATKWIVDMELTTLEAFKAYWVKRGWAQQVPVKTSSRIDAPSNGSKVGAGPVTVAGVAWAQDRGIGKVEVQIDGGDWSQATLAAEDTSDTWRQWEWRWEATPGERTLAVRATDDTGTVQIGEVAPPFPSGATGYHTIKVQVA